MDPFNDPDGEINVEGWALHFLAPFPFDQPAACRAIHKEMGLQLEETLKHRAARRGEPPPA